MRNKLLIVCILFSFSSPFGNLDRIRRALERLEFDKAYELLQKAQAKEPQNPGVDYFFALLYANDSFDGYDLDSARLIANLAFDGLEVLNDDERMDLADDGVTDSLVFDLQIDIRDRLYQRLITSTLQVKAVEEFMKYYPTSPYQENLIFKRDSMVYDKVKRLDELGVYEDYLEKYETSKFRDMVAKRIDELRFKALKHTGRLQDYYQFLNRYPQTAFKSEIEAFIFREATAKHTVENYMEFMRFAESRGLRKRTGDILYYMAQIEDFQFEHPLPDSISTIEEILDRKLILALEDGKFGFHRSNGSLQIGYSLDKIAEAYKCQLTLDEWLFVSIGSANQIINKAGKILIVDVDDYMDLGSGIAMVKQSGNWFLYHKSGFKIIEDVIEDATVLANRWIKVKKKNRWALVSVSGFGITDYIFSNIEIEGQFWIFEKEGLLALSTEQRVEEGVGKLGLGLEYKFDDYELVSENVLIGFRDNRECMLNDELDFLIPWGEYEINPNESGWYLKTSEGYRLYDHSEQDIMNQIHVYLESNSGWLALKTTEDWMLLSREKDVLPSRGYDSLKLINNYCAFTKKESLQKLLFSNGNEFVLEASKLVRTFVNQRDYVLIDSEDNKLILDQSGNAVLSGAYDEITFFNDSLMKVEVNGKNGLIQLSSEALIDISFDALDESDGLVLCLRDGKIGSLDLRSGYFIPTSYEARIERIGNNYLAKKEGKYGVIDLLEQEILTFDFDEIKFWNDTSYLVRNESDWRFLNTTGEQIGESVTFLRETWSGEKEQIWKYVKDGKYGLLSTINGILLEPDFTDVFNIGSSEDPIFFADQHLDKAGFHVVSYVNYQGELLFSKAYKKEEFDLILCDD